MVEEGHYKGGTAPVGYELVKSGRINKRKHELYDLKVKEDDADIVRLIFSKYVNEGYGVQKIANYLNDKGYTNPTGNRWSHNTIRNILQNETYIGILRSGNTRSPHLPELQIVSNELFDRAQQIRRERAEAKANTPRVPINMKGNSLLSGNVFCGHCGSRLHLTTTSRYYKKADGTVVKKRRVRYACYKKVRKIVECEGQSGYSAAKLDSLVEGAIKNVFKRMRGISKDEIIASRYDKELSLRKSNLIKAKADLTKEQEKLSKLKAEVIKSIQGESAYSPELLSGLVNETDVKVRELESLCATAERELAEKQILMKDLSDSYDEIISWSELYDSASFEAKKMIVNAMITRIDVFNGYELNIEFNFNISQFFEGIAEEKSKAEEVVALPKTA